MVESIFPGIKDYLKFYGAKLIIYFFPDKAFEILK